MILSFNNIRKVSCDGPWFSTLFPRDLANLSEWKIMFDPSIGCEITCRVENFEGNNRFQ